MVFNVAKNLFSIKINSASPTQPAMPHIHSIYSDDIRYWLDASNIVTPEKNETTILSMKVFFVRLLPFNTSNENLALEPKNIINIEIMTGRNSVMIIKKECIMISVRYFFREKTPTYNPFTYQPHQNKIYGL